MALIAIGVFFLPGLCLNARQKRKTHHVRRSTVHHKRRRVRRHYRRYRHYYRWSRYRHVHASRKRIIQIQEALAKAGYLHQKPDGIWGPATRDAMRQYQKDNGFAPTGLPEAKPLMKLGLGPHPLPPGLEPKAATNSEAQGQAKSGAAPVSSPEKKSSSSTQQ